MTDEIVKKPRHPGGRPSIYTEELANRICHLVAINPIGLPKLCAKYDELPDPDTIRSWRWSKPQFSAKYNEAKRFQSEIMAESIEDISDEVVEKMYEDEEGVTRVDSGIVSLAKLKVDSRKWTASKLAPKIYGDRQIIEQTTAENETLKAELAALKKELDAKNAKEF